MSVVELRPAVLFESGDNALRRIVALRSALEAQAELQSLYGPQHALSQHATAFSQSLVAEAEYVLRSVRGRLSAVTADPPVQGVV